MEGEDQSCDARNPKAASLCVPPHHAQDVHVPRSMVAPRTTPLSKAILISSWFQYNEDPEISIFHHFSLYSSFGQSWVCLMNVNRIEPFRKCCFGHFLLIPSKILLLLGFMRRSPQSGATKYYFLLSLVRFKPIITQASALTHWL